MLQLSKVFLYLRESCKLHVCCVHLFSYMKVMIKYIDDNNVCHIRLKIVMSHFQVISVVGNFELKWPVWMQTFFSYIRALSSPDSVGFSLFDCQLGVRSVFVKTLIYAMLPFFMVIILFVYWLCLHNFIIRCCSCKKGGTQKQSLSLHQLTLRLTLSIWVILFFLQPTLSTQTLKLFACRQLGRDPGLGSFLLADLTIECYKGEHSIWSGVLGVPCLLLFVFGIPVSAFILLCKSPL
jgi:hypothetical protein